jgi:hypothetical protein
MEEIELTNSWINSFIKFLCQIFDQFLEVCLRLECITSHPSLPALQMLMKECGLKQCEEVLEQIGEDIMTWKKTFPAKVGLKDVKMM